MRKIFDVIILLMGIVPAIAGKPAVYNGRNHVLLYEEVIDVVKTVPPAKSSTVKCSVKVDFLNGLVKVGNCDVLRINLYTKEEMWLGPLTTYYGEELFSANMQYTGVREPRNSLSMRYMNAEFDFEPMDATEDLLEYVSCPKNQDPIVKGDAFGCFRPYECPSGSYSVDVFNCKKLPEFAVRNSRIGYSCLKGYVSINGGCEKKAKCKKNEGYSKRDNRCEEIPENAHWNEQYDEFVCNDGYAWDDVQSLCRELVRSCDDYSIESVDGFSCVSIPNHSSKVTEYAWECNKGYTKCAGGTSCCKVVKCSEDEYNFTDYECRLLPKNSHRVNMHSWECNEGFFEYSGECRLLPKNSHRVDMHSWECNEVFFEDSGSCKDISECGDDMIYDASIQRCVNLPENAVKVGDEDWECEDEYFARREEDDTWHCYETGESVYEEIDLHNNLSMELAGFLGVNEIEESFKRSLNAEVGAEWLIGESINVGTALTVMGFYDEHENWLVKGTRLNLAFLLATRESSRQLYVRSFVSIGLGTAFKYSGNGSHHEPVVNTSAGGLEGGIRWGNSYANDFATDLFVRLNRRMYEIDEHMDNWLVAIGLRLVLF